MATITCPDCGDKFRGPTRESIIVKIEDDHMPCPNQVWSPQQDHIDGMYAGDGWA